MKQNMKVLNKHVILQSLFQCVVLSVQVFILSQKEFFLPKSGHFICIMYMIHFSFVITTLYPPLW